MTTTLEIFSATDLFQSITLNCLKINKGQI